jgi:hypothetical protein
LTPAIEKSLWCGDFTSLIKIISSISLPFTIHPKNCSQEWSLWTQYDVAVNEIHFRFKLNLPSNHDATNHFRL